TRDPHVHPGEVLVEEFLKPLNLSQRRLAGDIGVSPGSIGGIVRAKRPVSPEMALRLARYFCTADDFWLRLQADHDLEKARRACGKKLNKEITPRKTRL
ncbi:MAG: HigA family addiction module antitoxin, partial [Rhodospirillales bacterium]